MKKNKSIQIRIDKETLDELDELRFYWRFSRSEFIRMIIMLAYEEIIEKERR